MGNTVTTLVADTYATVSNSVIVASNTVTTNSGNSTTTTIVSVDKEEEQISQRTGSESSSDTDYICVTSATISNSSRFKGSSTASAVTMEVVEGIESKWATEQIQAAEAALAGHPGSEECNSWPASTATTTTTTASTTTNTTSTSARQPSQVKTLQTNYWWPQQRGGYNGDTSYIRLTCVSDLNKVKTGDMIQILTMPKVAKRDLQATTATNQSSKKRRCHHQLPEVTEIGLFNDVIREVCPISALPLTIKQELLSEVAAITAASGSVSSSTNSVSNSNKEMVAIKTVISIAVNRIVQDIMDRSIYYVVGKLIHAIVAHEHYYPEGTSVDHQSSFYKAVLKFDNNGVFINYSDIGCYPSLPVSQHVTLIVDSR